MELLFLGTGSGVPAKQRNVSSLALKLLDEINSIWLFDCGEATQHQILQTTLKPRKVNKIFISHMHGDHIFGLPGFLSSRAFQGGVDPVTVYGPVGIKQYILSSLKLSKTFLNYKIYFHEFEDNETLFDDDQYKVTVKQLSHGIPSYGFRIEEKDKVGSLMAEKLKEDNVPFGPLFGKLKNGETVELKDGRTINGKDYIGPPIKGRIVTILGDTKPNPNIRLLAKKADLLVHEGTFRHQDKEMAKDYNHSTNVQAARVAKENNVKKLVLNHISSRYLYNELNEMLQETREIFPNSFIMNDFSEVDIPQN